MGNRSRKDAPVSRLTIAAVKVLTVIAAVMCVTPMEAQSWMLLGPNGGDARSFADGSSDANRILLGTSTGTIFLSTDGGHSWSHWAHLGKENHYVIDHIIVDPTDSNIIFCSAWSVDSRESGEVFVSHDGGRTWSALPAMHGRPVRSLAMSEANPHILVEGGLDGVYLTTDSGNQWERISPENDQTIRNVESVAIDPRDPDVIYVGTSHLAWKTSNRGATWHEISRGMVDDSDVFSIVVDADNPQIIFASACSGIYKSVNAGETFHKVQGIPFSARRTRVLKEDPSNPNVLYAGTTGGLWKTSDLGKTWNQVTSTEIVVNDVFVDPRNSSRLLLATDRAGVLASDNGGQVFSPSNRGYTHRHVTAIVPDQDDPQIIFVGVAGDREWGGVFCLNEKEQRWIQTSIGLGGRDVLTLQQAATGALVAGTSRGIFILDRASESWRSINKIATSTLLLTHLKVSDHEDDNAGNRPASLANVQTNHLALRPDLWLAATTDGLFTSRDSGETWQGGTVLGRSDFTLVAARAHLQVLATETELLLSHDDGASWQLAGIPWKFTAIRGITLPPQTQAIVVVAREGVVRSTDGGKSWRRTYQGLPDKEFTSISWEAAHNILMATSEGTGVVFESSDDGETWIPGPNSGYPLLLVNVIGGRLFGATPFEGLVAQP
jgi:photosystem II stability/assembly factor-like uncharacterized protein